MLTEDRAALVSGISVFLVLFGVSSLAQKDNCASSSCGNITIRYPFRLTTTPESCGYDDPAFELKCQNNWTVSEAGSKRYIVQDINYVLYTMRLVDPTINRENLSSCPLYSNNVDVWPSIFLFFFKWNIPVSFVNCLAPVNSSKYVEGPFCGDRSKVSSHSSQIYSYIMVGDEVLVSDLEELCTVYRVLWSSGRRRMNDNSSLAAIYDYMAYGFELSWYQALCRECNGRDEYCNMEGSRITCTYKCNVVTPLSQLILNCEIENKIWMVEHFGLIAIGALLALRFLIGFPVRMVLVARKWRRRHLAMDETIEEFLQGQNNLTPIKYTYSQIKKTTKQFQPEIRRRSLQNSIQRKASKWAVCCCEDYGTVHG